MDFRRGLWILLYVAVAMGQRPMKVLDALNDEPVALALVQNSGRNVGTYSDLSGLVFWNHPLPDSLEIRCSGYVPQRIWIQSGEDTLVIRLLPGSGLEPVEITDDENPALRIIRQVIANRKRHFPLNNQPYTATIYSKLRMDIPQASDVLRPDSARFFYAMLWESLVREEHLDASHHKSTVLDSRLSGVQGRLLPLSPTDLQDISLYRDVFYVLQQPFTSPLSEEATSRYTYELGYLHIQGADTVFEIRFWPQNRSFNALEGRLYVSTNGYAIQGIEAGLVCVQSRPLVQDGRIRQYFNCMDDSIWVPHQLFSSLSIWLPGGTVDSLVLDARSDFLSFVPQCNRSPRDFNATTVDQVSSYQPLMDSLRPQMLEPSETLTYQMVDSMLQKVPMSQLLDQTLYLQRGFIRAGPFMIPLDRLITVNQMEELRVGAGIYLNPETNRRILTGGWAGYGIQDKQWKYGANAGIWLDHIQSSWFRVGISYDLVETGYDRPESVLGSPFRFGQPAEMLYRSYFLTRVHDEYRIDGEVRVRLRPRLWLDAGASHTRYLSRYAYAWRGDSSAITLPQLNVRMVWRPGIGFMRSGPLTVLSGIQDHTLVIGLERGVHFRGEGVSYSLLSSAWNSVFQIRRSVLLVRATAGVYTGSLPLYRLMVFRGNYTGRRNVTEIAAFDVMGLTEFAADQFVAAHMAWQPRWQLGMFRNWSPRVTLMGDIAYGVLSHPDEHTGVSLIAPDKIYTETGIGITHLFPDVRKGQMLRFMQFIGFSIHARVGAYAYPDWKQNLVFRLYTDLGRL